MECPKQSLLNCILNCAFLRFRILWMRSRVVGEYLYKSLRDSLSLDSIFSQLDWFTDYLINSKNRHEDRDVGWGFEVI